MGRVHPLGFWGRLQGLLVPLFNRCDGWRAEGLRHGVGAGGVALQVSVGALSHQADGDRGLAGGACPAALGPGGPCTMLPVDGVRSRPCLLVVFRLPLTSSSKLHLRKCIRAATGKMDRCGVDAAGLVRGPHGSLREGSGGELHQRPEGRPVLSPVYTMLSRLALSELFTSTLK